MSAERHWTLGRGYRFTSFGLQPRPPLTTRIRRLHLNELGRPDKCMHHGESERSSRGAFWR